MSNLGLAQPKDAVALPLNARAGSAESPPHTDRSTAHYQGVRVLRWYGSM